MIARGGSGVGRSKYQRVYYAIRRIIDIGGLAVIDEAQDSPGYAEESDNLRRGVQRLGRNDGVRIGTRRMQTPEQEGTRSFSLFFWRRGEGNEN